MRQTFALQLAVLSLFILLFSSCSSITSLKDLRTSSSVTNWPAMGFKGHQRGPWIDFDPELSIQERIAKGIANTLNSETKIRTATFPGAMVWMVWAYSSKKSTFYKNSKLKEKIVTGLTRIDQLIRSWRNGEKKIQHELSRASLVVVIWEITSFIKENKNLYVPYPEKTLDNLDITLRKCVDIMSTPNEAGSLWVWQTQQPWRVARLMTTMMVGYKLTGQKYYLDQAMNMVPHLHADIHALGGFRYITAEPYPNVQWYMDMTLLEIGNTYLMADDTASKKFRNAIKELTDKIQSNYIYRALPLVSYDYSGGIWNKTLYNNPPNSFGPGAISFILQDGQNATIARFMAYYNMGLTLELRYATYIAMKFASHYKSVRCTPLPTKYLIKDDSLNGIRGLDDNYAFVLNRCARLFTAVGARTSFIPEKRYTGYWGNTSTALMGVTPEVGVNQWRYYDKQPKKQPVKENKKNIYARRMAWRNNDEQHAQGDRILGKEVAAIGLTYYLPSHEKPLWKIDQLWFAHGKKLIGQVQMSVMQDNEKIYAATRLHFNFLKEITKIDGNTFRAKDFLIKIIKTDFKQTSIMPCETYCNEKQPRGLEIRYADDDTDGDYTLYSSGQVFNNYFLIQATDENITDSKVTPTHQGGILGFLVEDKKQSYQLYYRSILGISKIIPTDMKIPHYAKSVAGDTLIESWLNHPKSDRQEPEKYFYRLPQHSMIMFTWSRNPEPGNYFDRKKALQINIKNDS